MKKAVKIESNEFMRANSLNYSKYNFDMKTSATPSFSFANKNGKSIHKDQWLRGDVKPQRYERGKTDVTIQSEMARTFDHFSMGKRPDGLAIKEERRFDQKDKPVYPNFETTNKDQVMSNTGWGL